MIWRGLRLPLRTVIAISASVFLLYLSRSLIVHSNSSKDRAVAKVHAFTSHDEELSGVAGSDPASQAGQSVQLESCPLHLDWLKELEGSEDLRWPLRYTRRNIIVVPKPRTQHVSLMKTDGPLLPSFQQLESPNSPTLDTAHCLPPLILEVPVAARPDASHIILGTASSLARVDASIPFYQRWLAYTRARLIVSVVGPDDSMPDPDTMEELQLRMRGLGMAVTLVAPLNTHDSFVQRYFSLVKTLYESRDEKTTWLGFVDDDTFIVSMNALVERLDRYNSDEMHYLGALSEEWWTVVAYGIVGMGGAGIFLSLPLAEVIVDNFDDCKAHTTKIFGDHIIYECIYIHTDVSLTHTEGLFQLDLHGDRSGVFESGRRIISLHHWKEGYWSEDGSGLDAIRHQRWFPMDGMGLVKDVCGEDCFLQRWQFGNDAILTNGYSIASYPTDALNESTMRLDQMERTWVTPVKFPDDVNQHVAGSGNDGYDHYLCPCRPALKLEEEKIHWRFMDAKGSCWGWSQAVLSPGWERWKVG